MAFQNVFFSGKGSDLGTVSQMPIHTFKQLVDQEFNSPVPLNVTKSQFARLPKKVRDKKKRVAYIVPAQYPQSPSPRKIETGAPTSAGLICLDVDTLEDKEGNVLATPAKPYHDNPHQLADLLHPFNFLVHTTASSSPKTPRLRIIVEAAELPLDQYHAAVTTIASRIGLSEITTESFVPVQPMYKPVSFKGTDPELEHPLLASRTDGVPFTADDVENLSAEDYELLGLTPPKQQSRNHSAPRSNPDTASAEDLAAGLEFLTAPVEGFDLDDAEEMLTYIDPDCGYYTWFEVFSGLRHQFPVDPENQAAFELFDEWSAQGSKYGGRKETEAKWKSVSSNPNRKPKTIRSVIKMARDEGYHVEGATDKCFKTIADDIHKADTRAELLETIPRRIAASPLLGDIEVQALLDMIILQTKKELGLKITKPTMGKEYRRVVDKMKFDKAEEKATVNPPWTKGICYISGADVFFRHSTGETFSPQAVNRVYGKYLLPTQEMLAASGNLSNPAAASKPYIHPADYLLNKIEIPQAYETHYDPRRPGELFFKHEGKEVVNTYQACHPEPDFSRADEAGDTFMAHMQMLIGDEDLTRMVVDWMAYIVQNPGQKIRWAILLQGAEGCGKSFLSHAMATVLGQPHEKTVGNEAVFGNWNDWATGAQLVTLEEVRVVGHNRFEIMNKLKPLITNRTISISERFRPHKQVDNVTNYILYTNFHDALALTGGDRRYMVIKSPIQTKKQVESIGKQYFIDLHDMLEDNAEGLRAFFEDWKISKAFPVNGPAPRTRFLDEVVQDASDDVSKFIRETLEDGDVAMVQPDILDFTSVKALMAQELTKMPTDQHIGSVLRKLGFRQAGRWNLDRSEHKRHSIWVVADTKLTDQEVNDEATRRYTDPQGFLEEQELL